jgi:N-methylhydantoinase A
LRASIRTSQAKISTGSSQKTQAAQKQKPKKAQVLFGGKKFDTSVYDRDVMSIGKRYSGPAVITEYSATTVVPPGKSFWLDRAGNLMIVV